MREGIAGCVRDWCMDESSSFKRYIALTVLRTLWKKTPPRRDLLSSLFERQSHDDITDCLSLDCSISLFK